MTTLTLQESLPPGVYALYQAIDAQELHALPFLRLIRSDKKSLLNLLVNIALHPEEYPGLDPEKFDAECAEAAKALSPFKIEGPLEDNPPITGRKKSSLKEATF